MDTVFEIIAETYADKSQRKILYFLGLTLCFMVLEFVYGWLSNSLSLMSDSCHMLVDSLALMLGLCAAYVSKHTKPTRNMPYGYYRIESLSALCNSLFLIAVSYNLAFNSIDRLVHPQKINIDEYNTEMVFVSVGGLTINLIGLIFFSEDAQSSENIKGLFLHVLADTLGSLGVLLSCFLVKQFDMHRSDPVCALFVSLTIFVSVIPLLKSSSLSLLGQVP